MNVNYIYILLLNSWRLNNSKFHNSQKWAFACLSRVFKKCETCLALKLVENLQNALAQVSKDIFHQLYEHKIVKIKNKMNKTDFFTHLKGSEIRE